MLDKYLIIKNINIKNKNLSIFLYEITKNIAIEKAQNTFYKRLIKINKNIDFRIHDDSFVEIIDKINKNIDNLWIICIDPILQLYIPTFEKNILENMESQKIIKDKFKFSHQIYLFLEENIAKIEEVSLYK